LKPAVNDTRETDTFDRILNGRGEMRTLQPFTPSVADAPAWQLAQLIRQKQLSPVEVMDAHLQRIGECNPLVNAFACIDAENARAQAKRAEAILMAGETEKPLLGLPLSIKSSIDVEGFKCESGSLLRAGTVAAHDAPVVARLKQARAILIVQTMSYCQHYSLLGNPAAVVPIAQSPE
jgi:Asp-tRNA(Asn)/Glu-tRNA(Gln) amidotransferase A subunit family amidase